MKRGPKVKDFSKWAEDKLEEAGFSTRIKESVFLLGLRNLKANSNHMRILERVNESSNKETPKVAMDYRSDVPEDDSADLGPPVVDGGYTTLPPIAAWTNDASSGCGFGSQDMSVTPGDNGVNDSMTVSPNSD